MIVTIYPASPTNEETLSHLLKMQNARTDFEVRLVTCGLSSKRESIIACYRSTNELPTLLLGSEAGFEEASEDTTRLTIAFQPEPTLHREWANWFDVRWLMAAPLTRERCAIPGLVLPEGTVEANLRWNEYTEKCIEEGTIDWIGISPYEEDVCASAADGTQVPTVSAEYKLPLVSPIYEKLARLFDLGHLVSIDKSTRLRPLEVPVKAKWFGLETLRQIGTVRRQVSYHISLLKADELKSLENRRKKISELLNFFTFSIADGQRWMPKNAEDLFCQECERINVESKAILTKLVDGNLDRLLDSRRKRSPR